MIQTYYLQSGNLYLVLYIIQHVSFQRFPESVSHFIICTVRKLDSQRTKTRKMDTVVITSSDIVTSTAMVNRYLVVIPGWVTRQVIMLVGVLMVVVPAAMVEVTMVVLSLIHI